MKPAPNIPSVARELARVWRVTGSPRSSIAPFAGSASAASKGVSREWGNLCARTMGLRVAGDS
jgi:hypothetical protein